MNNLAMRLANKSDSQQMLNWRNHPNVRKYSRNSEVIAQDVHEVWLETKLNSAESGSRIFIFSESDKCIGMTRFDSLAQGSAEISILVDPRFHRKGIGGQILEKSIDYGFDTLNLFELQALIHAENFASAALFSKFGFGKLLKGGLFETYVLSKSS